MTYLGKLWKTTDGGATWTALLDFSPITMRPYFTKPMSFAFDPANPATLFVATVLSVYKSVDGGGNWTPLNSPLFNGSSPGLLGMLIDPSNDQILLVNANNGVYRSSDGGSTWTQVLKNSCSDMGFDPQNNNSAYCLGSGLFRSNDAGQTWTQITGAGQALLAKMVLAAFAPGNNQIGYFLGYGSSSAPGYATFVLYRTTDGGSTLTPVFSYPSVAGFPRTPPVLAIDPANPNVIFAGDTNLYRSLDGGTTWQTFSDLHSDHHNVAFSADGSRVFECNDGGVYMATAFDAPAPPKWVSLNANLNTFETESIAVDPKDANHFMTGTQDNTTLVQKDGAWSFTTPFCGDVYSLALDSANSSVVYATCGGILGGAPGRSNDFGLSWNTLSLTGGALLTGPTAGAVYAIGVPGVSGALRSLDSGATFTPIGPTGGVVFPYYTSGGISGGVAPSDPNTLYETDNFFHLWRTSNALAANPTWTDRGYVSTTWTYTATDPEDPNHLVAFGFAGGIGVSSDGGASWRRQSVSPASSSVFQAAFDPDLPGTIYAATNAGMVRSSDGGASWSPLGVGLPEVPVSALVVHRSSRTLLAATQGRGVWSFPIPLNLPRLNGISPATSGPAAGVNLDVKGTNFDSGSVIRWNGSDQVTTFVSATELQAQVPAAKVPAQGVVPVYVFEPGASGGLSNPLFVTLNAPFISPGGIVDAADPEQENLAPGTIGSIYGVNLASSAAAAPTLPLSTMLAGTEVLVNGIPAPLFYVSPAQINFEMPLEIRGDPVQVQVIANGVPSNSVALAPSNYFPASPGIFTIGGSYPHQGSVINATDGTIAAPNGTVPAARPARKGEYIEIFASGLGAVANPQLDGFGISSADPLVAPIWVKFQCPSVGGAENVSVCDAGQPVYAGLAPGFAGLYQVNVQVPSTAPSGSQVELQLCFCSDAIVPYTLASFYPYSNVVTIAIQ